MSNSVYSLAEVTEYLKNAHASGKWEGSLRCFTQGDLRSAHLESKEDFDKFISAFPINAFTNDEEFDAVEKANEKLNTKRDFGVH